MIRTAAGLLASLAVASASAQAPTPDQRSSAQPPSFRGGTVLVEIDAIVTDSSGRFVSGLTRDDFEVLEDGRPQRIDRLYTVSGTAAVPSRPVAEAPARPAFSPGAPGRVFVLLFDREHMQAAPFKRLQQAAITFLTTQLEQGDVAGVVLGDTMVGNHLTSNREELVAAVEHAKPDFSKTARRLDLLDWPRFVSEAEAVRIAISNDREILAQVVRRACVDDPDQCRQGADAVEPLVRSKARNIVDEVRPPAARTVRALEALASGLGRLPGRKTIVLMTDGFFIEESWADLRQIVGAAARSNVRIYSIDSRGVDTRLSNDFHQLSVLDPDGGPPLDAYNTIEDGPNTLAIDTGGYAIRHTNDFARALSEIARDTSEYYVIGYAPTRTAMDGTFRKVTVRVKRPGIAVRARRGYWAAPGMGGAREPETTEPGTGEPELGNRGTSGTEQPVLPLTVGVPEALLSLADATVSTATSWFPSPAGGSPGTVLRPDSNERIGALANTDGGHATGDSRASQGWDRYRSGDLEGAAALFEKAAATPDAPAWVHYAFGYSELGLRHANRAAQEWEKVRELVPEFKPVYLDLADAYVQLDSYGRALDVLKVAAARWPTDIDVLNAMGTIQVRRGALGDAIRTFAAAIAANPGDGLAYFNLARTHELRYYKLRRYSSVEGRWLGNRADVKAAIANYEGYLKLGGPYVAKARQALHDLAWVQ